MNGGKPLFRTFAGAEKVNAFQLADMWVDRSRNPPRAPRDAPGRAGMARTAAHEIDELAVMAALRAWLTRWLPVRVHRALLAGASVEETAAAVGVSFHEVARLWREWSAGQRALQHDTPGLPVHGPEHDRVEDLIRRAVADQELPEPVGNLRLT